MLMIPHTCREYFIGTYQDCFQIFFQSTEVILEKTGMWYPNRRLDFQAYAQPDCAHDEFSGYYTWPWKLISTE